MTAERITSVTLINCKNEPVTVFEIVAAVAGKTLLSVEKFNPPLVLKPLECLHVETAPVSAYLSGRNQVRT